MSMLGIGVLALLAGDTSRLPIEFVEPQEVKAALDAGANLVIVDVRSERAYKYGHIPGAINIPLKVIEENEDVGLKPDDMIVFYCDCPRGGIALKAAKILAKRGFKNLWVMLRGTRAWPGELESSPEE